MRGSKSKALRKQAKQLENSEETSYVFATVYAGQTAYKIQTTLVLSEHCVKGEYRKLKKASK